MALPNQSDISQVAAYPHPHPNTAALLSGGGCPPGGGAILRGDVDDRSMTNVTDLHQFRVQTPSFLITNESERGPAEVNITITFL